MLAQHCSVVIYFQIEFVENEFVAKLCGALPNIVSSANLRSSTCN